MFVWCDLVYGLGQYADRKADNNERVGVADAENSGSAIVALDEDLRRLFDSTPLDTTVLIVTQGSMYNVRQLAAKKMRSRWDRNAIDKGNNIGSIARTTWDSVNDENSLLSSAASAITGVVFVAHRG